MTQSSRLWQFGIMHAKHLNLLLRDSNKFNSWIFSECVLSWNSSFNLDNVSWASTIKIKLYFAFTRQGFLWEAKLANEEWQNTIDLTYYTSLDVFQKTPLRNDMLFSYVLMMYKYTKVVLRSLHSKYKHVIYQNLSKHENVRTTKKDDAQCTFESIKHSYNSVATCKTSQKR